MRRTLTTSFVALALVFGAAACGGEGAQQQIEEQQQQIEEQQQRIEEQQQRIQEQQEIIEGLEAPAPPGALPETTTPTQ